MLKNLSTTSKLYILVVFLFSLILGLGLYNNRKINTLKLNSDKMYDEVVDPIVQLTSMRYYYLRGIRTPIKQLLYNDTSYALSIAQLERTENKIESLWQNFIVEKQSPKESLLIAYTDSLIKETHAKTETLKATLYLEDRQAMQDFAIRDVSSLLERTVLSITDLIDYQIEFGKSIREKNSVVYQESKKRYQLVLIFTLLIAVVLGYFIVNDIRYLLQRLSKSNKRLQKSEMMYRSVFESAGDGLFLVGPNQFFKQVNAKGIELTGYSFEELIRMKPQDLHIEEDRANIPDQWSITPSKSAMIRQRKMLRKGGSEIDIEMNITVLENGEILGVVRDITKRLQIEKERKSSEEKFALASKTSMDAMAITTFPEGVFVEINDAFSQMSGYSSEEILGNTARDFNFYRNSVDRQKFISEIHEKGYARNMEITFYNRHGAVLDTLLTANLFKIDGQSFIFTIAKDISNEKNANLELKRVEKRITDLVDSTEAVLWEADAQTDHMTYVNPFVEKLFGYPVEDWYTENFWEKHIHPEDRAATIEYCYAQRQGLQSYTLEYRFIGKNQQIIWVRDIVHVIGENNQPKWLRGIMIDITEQKNAVHKLKLADLRLKKLVESTDVIIWEADVTNLKMEYISPNVKGLFGYDEKEWYEPDFWINHVSPKDKEESLEFCKSLIVNPRQYTFEYRFIKKNGEVLWLRDIANVIVEKGKPAWFRGISVDITKQKRKEQTLQEITVRLELATKSANIGVFDLDLNHLNLMWDETSFRIFGISEKESDNIYQTSYDAIHPDDRERVIQYRNKVIEYGGEYELSYRIIWPNGVVRFIESNAIVVRNSKGIPKRLIGVNRDITEMKYAQEQLQLLNDSLETKVALRTKDLQEANKKIKDSINYAQNIQLALLAKTDDCLRIFAQSFVLWKPKDAVSGDFFWCYSDSTYKYIAVVDCTGHGVPGALLSLVAKQTLDSIVISNQTIEPHRILHELNEIIVNSLQLQNRKVKDGMDIVFCRIEKESNKIVFAGAQRPLFYFNGQLIQEFSGSKIGIGGFLHENEALRYKQIEIQGKSGDVMYLTSDGYYSQFGGEKGKKLMKKRFCEYLLAVANSPISEQNALLTDYFHEWQGEEEQVDDVMVIGIQLEHVSVRKFSSFLETDLQEVDGLV